MAINRAFQPETVDTLAAVFLQAWKFIANDPHFASTNRAVLRRRLSVCLMELSAGEELDPLHLANAAISHMRQECGVTRPVA